jgi:hypothetical protein
MQNLDIYAKIFIGFVGFSGIVAALFSLNNRNWTAVDKVRLIILVGASFAGVFLSLIPSVIQYFVVDEILSWQIALGLFGVTMVIALGTVPFVFQRNDVFDHPDFSRVFMLFAAVVLGAFTCIAWLSSAGVYFEASIGIYAIGLMCVMFLSAAMFGLLVKFILKDVASSVRN